MSMSHEIGWALPVRCAVLSALSLCLVRHIVFASLYARSRSLAHSKLNTVTIAAAAVASVPCYLLTFYLMLFA